MCIVEERECIVLWCDVKFIGVLRLNHFSPLRHNDVTDCLVYNCSVRSIFTVLKNHFKQKVDEALPADNNYATSIWRLFPNCCLRMEINCETWKQEAACDTSAHNSCLLSLNKWRMYHFLTTGHRDAWLTNGHINTSCWYFLPLVWRQEVESWGRHQAWGWKEAAIFTIHLQVLDRVVLCNMKYRSFRKSY